MITFLLQGAGQGQKLRLRNLHGNQIRDPGGSRGDGAGLAQHHNLSFASLLQGHGGFEQNAVFALMPLPTIMATGVARPRTQGQLITSTAMPRARA